MRAESYQTGLLESSADVPHRTGDWAAYPTIDQTAAVVARRWKEGFSPPPCPPLAAHATVLRPNRAGRRRAASLSAA